MVFIVLFPVLASAARCAGAAQQAFACAYLIPVAGLATGFRDDHGETDAEERGQQADDGEAASEHVRFPWCRNQDRTGSLNSL
jgi:hypothetical protein